MTDKRPRFFLQNSPRKSIFTPDLYKNTEIILNPSRNSTTQSRQATHFDQESHSKQVQLTSRSSILSSHLQKEKQRSDLVHLNKLKLESHELLQTDHLKQKLHHRRVNSETLSSQFLQSRVSQVLKNLSNLKPNYEKALKTEISAKSKILAKNSSKLQQKPQKIADTLNKPGVTTWLNLASGGKLRSSSLDLPAPSGSRTLKTWDIFSGYLGADCKKPAEVEIEPQSKEERGFCYKLDPIYRAYTLGQAVHYLQLRKQGVKKKVAARLSQRIYCNLHQKQVTFEKNYSEEDLEYQKLVERFEKFANLNLIKEGEIVKEEKIDPGLLKIPKKTQKNVEEHFEAFKKEQISQETQIVQVKPKMDPKLLEIKKILRKSKISKALFTAEPQETSRSEFKEEQSDGSEKPLQEFSKDKVVKFLISAVLPKREIFKDEEGQEEVHEIQMEEVKLNESSEKIEIVKEKDPEEKMVVKVVDFHFPKFEEKRGKSKKVTVKSLAVDEKSKKKMDIKQEIQFKSNLILQQGLAKKLEKLKALAEEKKKAKEETLREIQKKKHEFMSKVQNMKEKKILDTEAETEQVLKRAHEKFRIVEENKKKLEFEKEKKREEQRQIYESQRNFLEYLRSLSLTKNEP